MEKRRVLRLIREDDFVLEIEMEEWVGSEDDPWSPTFSIADSQKFFGANQAMRTQDWKRAKTFGQLYRLEPVASA